MFHVVVSVSVDIYDTIRIVLVKREPMKKTTGTEPEPKDGAAEPGRPRDARATDAILRAALALGINEGFHGLTIEGIAAHAGVGKATIYRRWPDVWSVVVEAVMAEVT